MKKLSDEQVRMFDRMRARRGRIMKQLDAKAPDSGGTKFKGLHTHARQSANEAQGGKTGRFFDLTMILYLLILLTPFLAIFFGFSAQLKYYFR